MTRIIVTAPRRRYSRIMHDPSSSALHGFERAAWADLPALIRHIVGTHHQYARAQQPILQSWLVRLAERHGARHPELHQVRAAFDALSNELLRHMDKEENILFPYIEALWIARESGFKSPPNPFGTILNPIRAMEHEHREAGDLVARLRMLTNGYQPPDDDDMSFGTCYAELARFEADLHQHVHLENDVLFPRAIALESEM